MREEIPTQVSAKGLSKKKSNYHEKVCGEKATKKRAEETIMRNIKRIIIK
jgi:hypothetical protein